MSAHRSAPHPSLPPPVPRTLIGDLALLVGGRLAAERLLTTTTPRHLAVASVDELERLLPKAKADRLYRMLRFARAALTPERPVRIDDRTAVWRLLYPELLGLEAERFWAIPVDANCQPLAVVMVAEGTPCSVEVRPADVFSVAVRHRAVALVVAHNHPSGSLSPSSEDLALTERLIDGGELLGIDLYDHVVVSTSASTSLREEFAVRGRDWRSRSIGTSKAAHTAAVSALLPHDTSMRMTDRQNDQLLGHLEMLADRVRHLRDEHDREAPEDSEFGDLLTLIEDYDLLDDPTVLEAHSFLRGLAAGFGLEELGDLSAFARNRNLAVSSAPGWVELLTTSEAAASYLHDLGADDAKPHAERLRAAIAAWRRSPCC